MGTSRSADHLRGKEWGAEDSVSQVNQGGGSCVSDLRNVGRVVFCHQPALLEHKGGGDCLTFAVFQDHRNWVNFNTVHINKQDGYP